MGLTGLDVVDGYACEIASISLKISRLDGRIHQGKAKTIRVMRRRITYLDHHEPPRVRSHSRLSREKENPLWWEFFKHKSEQQRSRLGTLLA